MMHQHHDTNTIPQTPPPSLGSPGSGLPSNSCALGLLPVTLDTPMNRKFMPDADMSVMLMMNRKFKPDAELSVMLPVMLNRKLMLDKGMSVMMMMIVSRKFCWMQTSVCILQHRTQLQRQRNAFA